MSGELKFFPGVGGVENDAPDDGVIKFCEDLVRRARSGEIRGIAVAMVRQGRVTLDGWKRQKSGEDCCHELMGAITYLQIRYANACNNNNEPEAKDK